MFVFIWLISLSCIFIGLLTLARNKKSSANISFAIFSSVIGIWILANYFGSEVKQEQLAKLLVQCDFFFALMIANSFLIFTTNLGSVNKKIRNLGIYFLTPLSLFVGLSAFFGQIVISQVVEGGVKTEGGNLYYHYIVLLLSQFLIGIIFLIYKRSKANGREKAQISIILFGLFISIALALLSNVVIPNIVSDVLQQTTLLSLGYLGIVIFAGVTSYAIIRHKLFDIRAVVARSVTYILSIITIGVVYGLLAFNLVSRFFPDSKMNTAQQTVYTLLAVALAFTFAPLKRFFERVTDRIFFRDKYDPQAVINSIGRVLASEIQLERLVDKVTSELTTEMRITSADIVVVGDKNIFYQNTAKVSRHKYEMRDLKKLSKSIIVVDNLASGERKELMTHYGVSVSLAMRTSEEFIGYLLLGEKRSGDIYNETDLRVLRIVANELAIAIQNAKSFAEIQLFNETLQTKITQATQKLRHANEDLKRLDQAKDEFISMASHQLRTPLTTTKGYVSMVLEGDFGRIGKDQAEPLQQALDSANRMGGLVNDLLNVSRMDAGKFFIDAHETDLTQLVHSEVDGLQTMADSKKVKLIYHAPVKTLPLINLDEEKTRQVVMNLIDNAIHYSSPTKSNSEVKISLEQVGQDVIFKVEDNGIGVPDSMKAKLFTKFYRASNAQAARPDGTGLGLYLVKRVVEDQGGKLIFESAEGVGSTFGFCFPLKTKFKSTATKAHVPLK